MRPQTSNTVDGGINEAQQQRPDLYQHSSTYTLGHQNTSLNMSPPGTKQTTAGGMLGGKIKGLQVQGTAGIVKANPAFVIKTTMNPPNMHQQSPLKTGGKGNIYPSYQLS